MLHNFECLNRYKMCHFVNSLYIPPLNMQFPIYTQICVSMYNVEYVVFQCSDKLGLSLELGSFAAGVMISTTDLAHHTLEQVSFVVIYSVILHAVQPYVE